MFQDLDARLTRTLARFSHLTPTLLRVALGTVFLAHAYGKAAVFTFAGTEKYFEANGFPGWTAYPVFATELAGGLALLLGFRVRAVAIALLPVMLGALKPHLGNGWLFTSSGGGWEYPAFLLVALVSQALLGAGPYALGAGPYALGAASPGSSGSSGEDDRGRREEAVSVA